MKEDVSMRLIEYVQKLISEKAYKSERDFLMKLGLPSDKFANARSGKSYITLDDIGIILTHHPEIDANWLLGVSGTETACNNLDEAIGIIKKLTDIIALKEEQLSVLRSMIDLKDKQEDSAL